MTQTVSEILSKQLDDIAALAVSKESNPYVEIIQQLPAHFTDMNQRTINIKYPPLAPMEAAHSIDEIGYENFDSSVAINAMVDYAYDNNVKAIFAPDGTYLANINLKGGLLFYGAGRINTIIKSYNPALPCVSTGQNLYITISDMDINAPYEQTAALLDLRGSRYFIGENLRIFQLPNELGEYSYSAKCIDTSIASPATWVGYNRLRNVSAQYGSYGLFTGGGLNSALSLEDCNMSNNGYYNIYLDGVEVAQIRNQDCAGGGQLAGPSVVDKNLYGGIYIKGKNIDITSVWYENNHAYIANSTLPNNCYIHPESVNITLDGERIYWTANNNTYMLEEEIKGANSRQIVPYDMGIGKGRPFNIIPNSCFKYLGDSNTPIKWNKINTPTITPVTNGLPIGIESAIQLTGTGGLTGIYCNVYDSVTPANGLITDLAKYIGQEIIMTFYVKTSDGGGTGRAGLHLVTGNYFASGDKYLSVFNTTGQWVKVVQRYKIVGNEIYIRPQFQIVTTGETYQITQVLFAFDDHVIDTGDAQLNLQGSVVWNPASLADGTGETSAAITITGAELGDYVLVSAPYDLQGITCNAYVSATNTVKIRLQNETGSVIDLASGTWKVKVIKA